MVTVSAELVVLFFFDSVSTFTVNYYEMARGVQQLHVSLHVNAILGR